MTTTPAGVAPASLDAARTHLDSPHGSALTDEQKAGLSKLREPFPAEQIAKRPQPTCRACLDSQTRCCQSHRKEECQVCGQYMTNAHIHLDYVGHAEATDRLLSVDPLWNWEPVAWTEHGTPQLDHLGGMWIRLTVCGITRLGYGDAQGKKGTNAMKEIIGDAIRNASMRFGLALDLWAKTDLPDHTAPHPAEIFYDRLLKVRGDRDAIADLELEVNDACQAGWMIPGRTDGLTLGGALARAKAQCAPAPVQEDKGHPANVPDGEPTDDDVYAAMDADSAAARAQAQREMAGRDAARANAANVDRIEDDLRRRATDAWRDLAELKKVLSDAQTRQLSHIPAREDQPGGITFGVALRQQIEGLARMHTQQTTAAA